MFIKIFTPNKNGKIELTIEELEALIQEAVDKALHEKDNKNTQPRMWGRNEEIVDWIALQLEKIIKTFKEVTKKS
jgi:hypothetical protein